MMLPMALALATAPLHWPAPRLEKPQTILLNAGPTVTRLDANKDYVLKLPSVVKRGSTVILGGRNVILIGGHISVPESDKMRRAIYIKGATGTVHIEGVLISNPDGGEFDAIAIAAPDATVQVERVRVEGLQGTQATFHSDVIQPWGGVRELRVDQLTATSGYQGIQLPDMHGGKETGLVSLSRVNLRYTAPVKPQFSDGKPNKGGFLLWTIQGRNCALNTRMVLRDVYIVQNSLRSPETAVWPPANSQIDCASAVDHARQRVMFRNLPIDGTVTLGEPPHGDFVPAGVAGESYRSREPVADAEEGPGGMLENWGRKLYAFLAATLKRLG